MKSKVFITVLLTLVLSLFFGQKGRAASPSPELFQDLEFIKDPDLKTKAILDHHEEIVSSVDRNERQEEFHVYDQTVSLCLTNILRQRSQGIAASPTDVQLYSRYLDELVHSARQGYFAQIKYSEAMNSNRSLPKLAREAKVMFYDQSFLFHSMNVAQKKYLNAKDGICHYMALLLIK